MRIDITPEVWADIRHTGLGDNVRVVVRDVNGYVGQPRHYTSLAEATEALRHAKLSSTIPVSHQKAGGALAWLLITALVAGVFSVLARLPLFTGVCFVVFMLAVC